MTDDTTTDTERPAQHPARGDQLVDSDDRLGEVVGVTEYPDGADVVVYQPPGERECREVTLATFRDHAGDEFRVERYTKPEEAQR